jgi:hypothetical protein
VPATKHNSTPIDRLIRVSAPGALIGVARRQPRSRRHIGATAAPAAVAPTMTAVSPVSPAGVDR